MPAGTPPGTTWTSTRGAAIGPRRNERFRRRTRGHRGDRAGAAGPSAWTGSRWPVARRRCCGRRPADDAVSRRPRRGARPADAPSLALVSQLALLVELASAPVRDFSAPVAQRYLLEARQMQALSLAVHIPLVCFGIAFPAMVLFVEGLYLRTGDQLYRTLARRWSKVMLILFAIGVVT